MAETETSKTGRAITKSTPRIPSKSSDNGVPTDEVEASVLVTKDGATIIHNDVVAKIAGMAVQEVNGVRELVPYDAGQSVTKLANRVMGRSMRDLGIQVEVGKTQAAVDVRIITEYGVSIVEISQHIRKNVRKRVESMTGLECVEVNIEVVDLFFVGEADDDQTTLATTRVQ